MRVIRKAINEHDPLRLRAEGAPADEYDPEAAAIARAVASATPPVDYVGITADVFDRSFRDTGVPREAYAELAARIARAIEKGA